MLVVVLFTCVVCFAACLVVMPVFTVLHLADVNVWHAQC